MARLLCNRAVSTRLLLYDATFSHVTTAHGSLVVTGLPSLHICRLGFVMRRSSGHVASDASLMVRDNDDGTCCIA